MKRFNFFARNDGTFVALALIGGLAIVPFALNNFVQGRLLLGAFNAALAAWFLVHGISVYRGRHLLPPPAVFAPAIAMLAYAMWARGEVGIFWAYPAVLLFHFILGRRAANYFNFSVMVFTSAFAYSSYGPDVALRVGVTLFLTIVFANVFSYVSETQRGREAEQEQLLELERDRLALLVHATQAGFTDWDTQQNVVIYSERFKEMLGYSSDFDTSAWHSFFDLMHPQDHARVREVFRALMREKRKPGLQLPGEPLEYRLLHAGGSHVWVKAASLAQVNAAGRIRRFITSFQDITKYREQEASLRTEQRRLDLVVRASRAGIVDWDGRTRATWYSPRFREMLGYATDADTASWPDYFKALIHPEDRERVTARFREYIRGSGPEGPVEHYEPEEYRLLRADGRYVWVQSQGVCVRDEKGFVMRFIAAITDITDRRDQDKFSGDVFDALPIGLAMRDLEGRYVFVNRTWEEYTGARREDVIGKTVRDRAPKEEAERVEGEDHEALARGPDAPPQLKDLHYGDKRYVLTRTVITDANGAPRGVVVASLDTTERHAMEEKLVGEQRRAALIVRAANVGILDWDGISRTVYYSPRFKEMLRYPPDADSSGWPDYFDLVHAEDKERVQSSFREHIRAAGPERTEEVVHELIQYRLRRADGTYVWVEAFGASVRDVRGFATRFIASISDISERRFQEEALRSAVRLREEVERMSRHDLKTPINSVIAMTRLLREEGRLGREDAEMLGSIERAGYRVLNMVNLSLDLVRMEQGSYEFRPQAVDMAEVARRVAADLESQAASKGVAVRVHAEGARSAHAEEPLCYSMLANLMKNAIEASPDERAVTVSIEAIEGGVLAVNVHNHGAVPDAIRPRFFQKYATAGKSGGLGLGAYSARLLARIQQGDILLHTSEAAGTTLTVRLALAARAATPVLPALKEKETSFVPPVGSRRVLVVDDDDFNRLVLRRFLPSPPFEVEEAVNGRAALDAARRNWPDAVLLDLEMPIMDGAETAARLRELEREGGRKRCTIVAISSNDEDAIIKRALAAGCDHYQVKPAPRETLLRLLAGDGGPARPAAEAVLRADAHASDAVELDADLEAALPGFLASRREALGEMAGALGDRARFKRLAHKLAGSFNLYGFRWAAEQCRSLEKTAASADAGDLARGTDAVRAHLDTVKVRLKVPLRSGGAK